MVQGPGCKSRRIVLSRPNSEFQLMCFDSYLWCASYLVSVRMSFRHDDCSLLSSITKFLWGFGLHATGHLVDNTGNAES
jgi:hypothetical protein